MLIRHKIVGSDLTALGWISKVNWRCDFSELMSTPSLIPGIQSHRTHCLKLYLVAGVQWHSDSSESNVVRFHESYVSGNFRYNTNKLSLKHYVENGLMRFCTNQKLKIREYCSYSHLIKPAFLTTSKAVTYSTS